MKNETKKFKTESAIFNPEALDIDFICSKCNSSLNIIENGHKVKTYQNPTELGSKQINVKIYKSVCLGCGATEEDYFKI